MKIEHFIDEYSNELVSGNAAYFIGSGISQPSDLPGWVQLLEPFARRLNITDLKGKDLPLIAQFIVNEENGNRGPFIRSIAKQLIGDFPINCYHESIIKTNIKTIWTTNFDNLLEKAFSNHTIDVKIDDGSISQNMPDAQLEIIKMHGSIFSSQLDDIVITQSDYEDFFINRPATTHRLKMDLLQKSFLFMGYRYGDPNIQNIVIEARRLSRSFTRQHYLIIRRERNNEFDLWSKNLAKYGIKVVEIEKHSELQDILEQLSLKSRGKTVFITGSHNNKHDHSVEEISNALAEEKSIILIDGQSTGVMRQASSIFMERVIEQKTDINKRLRFFPNPYAANDNFTNDPSYLPMLKNWRLNLFKATQVVIAFDGAMGTKAEIEKALELGCVVIPFFRNDESQVWSLIDDPILANRLNTYDGNYIYKLKQKMVTTFDVIQLAKKILTNP